MKKQVAAYRFIIGLTVCLLLILGSSPLYAQRAKNRRQGLLTADSIKAKHTADSLALLDSADLNQRAKITTLQSPVDTSKIISRKIQPTTEQTSKRWIPNSAKSVWLALAFPGAGQIYNKKYWKLPIIYGGFVGCIYALNWNNNIYQDYSQAYQDIVSNNPNNTSYLDFLPPNINVQNDLKRFQDIFKRRKDFYRRQRDLSIFVFIGVYVLSVIDAYVDAELSDFDISTDLSMKVSPEIFNVNNPRLPKAIGLSCSINF